MGSSEMRGRFQAFVPVHELDQGKARRAHIQKDSSQEASDWHLDFGFPSLQKCQGYRSVVSAP